MKKHTLIYVILALFSVIVLTHSVAMHYSWYFYHWWLDMPMHFFGGFCVVLTTLWLIFLSGKINIPSKYREPDKVVVISLVTVGIVGLLWEIFEFSIDTFLIIAPMYDVADTLSDLAFDASGALAASTYFTSNQLYKK